MLVPDLGANCIPNWVHSQSGKILGVTRHPAARGSTKTDRFLQHCVYMIATGKWRAGERLASIRTMRREWGLNQEAVQTVYARLIESGLVESRARSGFFVRGDGGLERLSQHRMDLARLHERVSELIRSETGLSTLGVLRYLTRLEEIERQQEPEVWFVECTHAQATGHALEIAERLGIPVAAATVEEVRKRRGASLQPVRTILTSAFHIEEVRSLPACRGVRVASVPIEVSPEIQERLQAFEGDLVLLESEETMASHLAEDTARVSGRRPRVEIVDDAAAILRRLLGGTARKRNRPIALLSPRLWGDLDQAWQNDPHVLQVSFRIVESAWPRVVDECGLPF